MTFSWKIFWHMTVRKALHSIRPQGPGIVHALLCFTETLEWNGAMVNVISAMF